MSGRGNFPELFVKAPIVRFFLKKYFGRLAYKKIKIEDGIDVEVLGISIRDTWRRDLRITDDNSPR